MFEYFKTLIEEAKRKEEEKKTKINDFINSFNDEIVSKSSFVPLKRGGANFKTHQLVIDEYGNYLFKVKYWFPSLFVIVFSIPLIASLFNLFKDILNNNINIDTISSNLGGIIIGGIITGIIGGIFWFISKSKIFDFQNGYFYELRNQKRLFELLNNEKYKNKIIPIKEIHAIQIVSELVSGKNSSYTSYELNMILKNSQIVNVIDHGDIEEIRRNAQELSTRLGVKIYDITDLYE